MDGWVVRVVSILSSMRPFLSFDGKKEGCKERRMQGRKEGRKQRTKGSTMERIRVSKSVDREAERKGTRP